MTTSSTQTMTADEIKRMVHALISQRRYSTIEQIADALGVSRRGLFNYMDYGLPDGDGARLKALRARLIELAAEPGAVTV